MLITTESMVKPGRMPPALFEPSNGGGGEGFGLARDPSLPALSAVINHSLPEDYFGRDKAAQTRCISKYTVA